MADDHLSLVAGLRRDQVARLEAGGVPTLTVFAGLPISTRVARVPRDTLYKLRRQAALQLYERHTGEQIYELLPYLYGYGFGQLPEPAPAIFSSTSRATHISATRASNTCSGWAGWLTTAVRPSAPSGHMTAQKSAPPSRG